MDCFISFKEDISKVELPKLFTYPFYYEPHPLCVQASLELQQYLEKQKDWHHNFGLEEDIESLAIGKMFGVLVVQNSKGDLGYLRAFSGKLQNDEQPEGFVPFVNEKLDDFKEITLVAIISASIDNIQADQEFIGLKQQLDLEQKQVNEKIESFREQMRKAKKERKEKRLAGFDNDELIKESYHYKHQLKVLTEELNKSLDTLKMDVGIFQVRLDSLIKRRKEILADLQFRQLAQYQLLNIKGEVKSLNDIFGKTPPPGTGDCAAPKLLQYAFKNNLKPIAMAEFWWGAPHKSQVRIHKNFYPACRSRCMPILEHMLHGIDVEENPMLTNTGFGKEIETIYEDSDIIVINKPEGLLSVPGKTIKDSVATRLSDYQIVHRLDQETSGLMLLAKHSEAHRVLQDQFINRTIDKTYIAKLDGFIDKHEGVIDLPLRVDLNNRPRQLVCYNHGKKAKTEYKVISSDEIETLIQFHPITGRTHQLRMHAAHPEGLATPIIGDTLYGVKKDRLLLHASRIEFNHPKTNKRIYFEVKENF